MEQKLQPIRGSIQGFKQSTQGGLMFTKLIVHDPDSGNMHVFHCDRKKFDDYACKVGDYCVIHCARKTFPGTRVPYFEVEQVELIRPPA